jgi:hypothetical protein
MSNFLLTTESEIECIHGGVVRPGQSEPRVLVEGNPVLPQPYEATVEGCPLTLPAASRSTGAAHTLVVDPPCFIVDWTSGTTRVTSLGQPLLFGASVGIASPSGTEVIVTPVQSRVQAV